MEGKITGKRYYRIEFQLMSALSIGGGGNAATDKDLLLDSAGKPYIPGSTLTGIYRTFYRDEEANRYFGYIIKNTGGVPDTDGETETAQESAIIVYDAVLPEGSDYRISARDCVGLDEWKTARDGAKFDFEILEPGVCFVTYLEQNKREGDPNAADRIAEAWAKGKIRIGGKTGRGLGAVKVKAIRAAEFILPKPAEDGGGESALESGCSAGVAGEDTLESGCSAGVAGEDTLESGCSAGGAGEDTPESGCSVCSAGEELPAGNVVAGNLEDWLAFDLYDENAWAKAPAFDWLACSETHWKESACPVGRIEMELSLKQNGPLSVRSYTTSGEADEQQLAYDRNGKRIFVIPGTSWAGAFRHHMEYRLGAPDMELWFGGTEDGRSAVSFGESELEEADAGKPGAREKILTRNAIDRFTGGTVENALFTGAYCWGGTTSLRIAIDLPFVQRRLQKRLENLKQQPEKKLSGNRTGNSADKQSGKSIGYESAAEKKNVVQTVQKQFLQRLAAAVLDLHLGFLSVGGETSVGHGLFAITGITVQGEEVKAELPDIRGTDEFGGGQTEKMNRAWKAVYTALLAAAENRK